MKTQESYIIVSTVTSVKTEIDLLLISLSFIKLKSFLRRTETIYFTLTGNP